MSKSRGGLRSLKRFPWLLSYLGVVFAGCSSYPKAVPIQNAKPGDLLVNTKGNQVELVRAFTPGIANGLHKGWVKVTSEAGDAKGKTYQVTAICSIKGEPGWPPYDNIFGDLVNDLNFKGTLPPNKRWQFLFYFDGRTEKTGTLESNDWVSHLKDNLCRKGDFDDT